MERKEKTITVSHCAKSFENDLVDAAKCNVCAKSRGAKASNQCFNLWHKNVWNYSVLSASASGQCWKQFLENRTVRQRRRSGRCWVSDAEVPGVKRFFQPSSVKCPSLAVRSFEDNFQQIKCLVNGRYSRANHFFCNKCSQKITLSGLSAKIEFSVIWEITLKARSMLSSVKSVYFIQLNLLTSIALKSKWKDFSYCRRSTANCKKANWVL